MIYDLSAISVCVRAPHVSYPLMMFVRVRDVTFGCPRCRRRVARRDVRVPAAVPRRRPRHITKWRADIYIPQGTGAARLCTKRSNASAASAPHHTHSTRGLAPRQRRSRRYSSARVTVTYYYIHIHTVQLRNKHPSTSPV